MRTNRISPALLVVAMAAASAAAFAIELEKPSIRIAVVAPDNEAHFAWATVRELERAASGEGLVISAAPAPLVASSNLDRDFIIMPVRSLATQVPALEILELPFFYPSLDAVHANLDGALGERLRNEARDRGWTIAAFWDEGMHIMSGLTRFDRVRNLAAKEFLITRPDPVAERQFQYWKADARRIRPENREAVLRECLIASRATTLQEIMREQLYRVHLDMSLTNHRYEGWVVIAPTERWTQLDPPTREGIERAMKTTTAWQRLDAQARASTALTELQRLGMTIYDVDEMERDAFRAALPDWADLLSDTLSTQQKRELIDLASAGTAAFVATTVPTGIHPPDATAPDAHENQHDQRGARH